MTAMPTGYASLSKENTGFMGLFRKSLKGGSLEIPLTFIPAQPHSWFLGDASFFQDSFSVSAIVL